MDDCEKCGKVHQTNDGNPSCKGHQRHTGLPCRSDPMRGQAVCRYHGGGSRKARVKGMERQEVARAESMLAALGNPEPIEHPVYELVKILSEMKAAVAYFRERMSELDELYTTDDFGAERERVLVLLYERAVERFSKTMVDFAKLDLQTRALALQRDAAAEMMGAIVTAMGRIGLMERTGDLRGELARVLREMHGELAPQLPG